MTNAEKIAARLREIIAVADAATPGPWVLHEAKKWPGIQRFVYRQSPSLDGHLITKRIAHVSGDGTPDRCDANTVFIAQSRTVTPQMARALLRVVECMAVERNALNDDDRPAWMTEFHYRRAEQIDNQLLDIALVLGV